MDNKFEQYKEERDIPDPIRNTYLRKYQRRYKLFKGEEGIWKFLCRHRQVEPYALKKGLLSYYGTALGAQRSCVSMKENEDFRLDSKKGVLFWSKPPLYLFLESNLVLVQPILGIRKSRKKERELIV